MLRSDTLLWHNKTNMVPQEGLLSPEQPPLPRRSSVSRRSSSRVQRRRKLSAAAMETAATREAAALRWQLEEAAMEVGRAKERLETHKRFLRETFGKPKARLPERRRLLYLFYFAWWETVLARRVQKKIQIRKECNLRIFARAEKYAWTHVDASDIVCREVFMRWRMLARFRKEKDWTGFRNFKRIFQSTMSLKDDDSTQEKDIIIGQQDDDEATVFTQAEKRRGRHKDKETALYNPLVSSVTHSSPKQQEGSSCVSSWRPPGLSPTKHQHDMRIMTTRNKISSFRTRPVKKPSREAIDSAIDLVLRRQMLQEAEAIRDLLDQKRALSARVAAFFKTTNPSLLQEARHHHFYAADDLASEEHQKSTTLNKPQPIAFRPPFDLRP